MTHVLFFPTYINYITPLVTPLKKEKNTGAWPINTMIVRGISRHISATLILLIHMADPLSRPVVITILTHVVCLSPLFKNDQIFTASQTEGRLSGSLISPALFYFPQGVETTNDGMLKLATETSLLIIGCLLQLAIKLLGKFCSHSFLNSTNFLYNDFQNLVIAYPLKTEMIVSW